MGKLDRLELVNFKSYKGKQLIGPFDDFTAIIGPNGSGKSNLMDAISFVLGINSTKLRSSNLKDLVHKGDIGREGTSVSAYYVASEEEYKLERRIHAGQSEFRINDKAVTFAQYNAFLEKQNILLKARNFLVFQGDVESVASMSSKDLCTLIEQISGSADLAEEYSEAKREWDRAIEQSTQAAKSRRGVNAEIKQVKEQKEEALQFEKLVSEKYTLRNNLALWKLFQLDQKIQKLEQERTKVIDTGIEAEKKKFEAEIQKAKKEQARINKSFLSLEKQIKKGKIAIDSASPALQRNEQEIKFIKEQIRTAEESQSQLNNLEATKAKEIKSLEAEIKQLESARQVYESKNVPLSSLTENQIKEYNRM